MSQDICFVDTETLGIDPKAPIWEFAAYRITNNLTVSNTANFTIRHDPGHWYDTLPESFQLDYQDRYQKSRAWSEFNACTAIARLTQSAIIVGSNPSFDMERLEILLRRNRFTPSWHYHPLDIPSMVLARLAAQGRLPAQPWKSDALSKAIGVDPADYPRHTALGDVRWCRAQWDVLTRPLEAHLGKAKGIE